MDISNFITVVISALFLFFAMDIGRYFFYPKTASVKIKELTHVPFHSFSPHLVCAVIHAEDYKFLQHRGFDWEAIGRAIKRNIKERKIKYGGSTITQQLVKNLYLSNSRSIIRKLKEAILTWRVEKALPKQRILELYLNIVEWGPNIHGAEAAARHYFDKSARHLTLDEAIRLASILPNPKIFQPFDNSEYLRRRRRTILYFMKKAEDLPSQNGNNTLYPEFSPEALRFRYSEFEKWQRPAGPQKIAIQAGHWINGALPQELQKLKERSGAEVNSIKEVEINKAVGEKIREILDGFGYNVELRGATVEPRYYADVFLVLHANYLPSQRSGFMIATPSVDYSGKGARLLSAISKEYQKKTGLEPIVYTKAEGLTHYYAFNWSKFLHSIHPKTPAVIIELGTMNNPKDLQILLNKQEMIARAIAQGIISYLKSSNQAS